MKILVALSALQILVLTVLLTRITALEPDVISIKGPAATERASEVVSHTYASPFMDSKLPDYPSESRLRAVIREELQRQLAMVPAAELAPNPALAVANGTPIADAHQVQLVEQELEYYVSLGSISRIEMANLQRQIAGLDDASRKDLLRKLTKALNSRSLDGRL